MRGIIAKRTIAIKLLAISDRYDLLPHFAEPTRRDKRTGRTSQLDQIFSNFDTNEEPITYETDVSDHYILHVQTLLEIEKEEIRDGKPSGTNRLNEKHVDQKATAEEFAKIDWEKRLRIKLLNKVQKLFRTK